MSNVYKDDHFDNMPYLSDEGKKMEQELKELADTWGYKSLPPLISMDQREHYMTALAEFWRQKYGRDLDFANIRAELTTQDGTVLASGLTKRGFVCGDYGIFLEIPSDMINHDAIKVQSGQEYRINDPRYSDNVKYHWYTDKENNGIKLYHQQKTVTYADYRPDMWYVSPYEVTLNIIEPEKEKRAMNDIKVVISADNIKQLDGGCCEVSLDYYASDEVYQAVSRRNDETRIRAYWNEYSDEFSEKLLEAGIDPETFFEENIDNIVNEYNSFLDEDMISDDVEWDTRGDAIKSCVNDAVAEAERDKANHHKEERE